MNENKINTKVEDILIEIDEAAPSENRGR